MKIGTKIKANTEFNADILEAEIKEIRFHMAKVVILKSTKPERVGEELVVLLNEFDVLEGRSTEQETASSQG